MRNKRIFVTRCSASDLPTLELDDDMRPIRMRLKSRSECRIDANEVGCRDLLAEKNFLLSTFRNGTTFARRRAGPGAHGRHWQQRDHAATRRRVRTSFDD